MTMTAIASTATDRPCASNDNLFPDGQHTWPAADRLRAGRLMRTPEANRKALAALVRLRRDLDAIAGLEGWTVKGDSAAVATDIKGAFQPDRHIENVTAEHLIALHLVGALEYRTVNGMREVCERDGAKVYQIEDRLRGEKGPQRAEHPAAVEADLNGRYSGARWPTSPKAAKSARLVFVGASIRCGSEPRATASPEDRLLHGVFARRTVAFIKGAMPSALWGALISTADGATAQSIGEDRGHAGKYASTVGTEIQRLALEALIEAYADYAT